MQKENFVKCDWPDTNFPSEINFEVENFQLFNNNDIFGKFSVRGNFSLVEFTRVELLICTHLIITCMFAVTLLHVCIVFVPNPPIATSNLPYCLSNDR